MASRSPHNGGGAPAKVQVGVNAALALFYRHLRKLGFSSADAKRLLLKMCRKAIDEIQ
jgi:hypothetical protein